MKSGVRKKLVRVRVNKEGQEGLVAGAVVQGISFEAGLLPKAKERAKERRRNLSAHVCDLIHADLETVPKN